ncbi:uncharacterized protein J4E78_000869 [Alternaria triticimaculans]|uniref:uncharacterized protein n=1 Tax=Alternaria triticimaculans TaxID=297637 RepID=UPI0020C3AE84|nr:uncharacterized protein J4E78_000869 [Alternaria triticimaculans]KAI4672368.1 hypothetical protein J4E78_000869 [Alternaria triticimaculans]
MAPAKAPAGQFSILYFAAASTFTGKTSEHLPAPVRARDVFAMLEERYPDIRDKVLSSCAMTINMEYVDVGEDDAEDANKQIVEGDEVAIIPPLSQPAPLGNILDPALEQTSPTAPGTEHDDDDHDDHDDAHEHDTPGSGKSPADLKRPRACDSCRGLKVRCDQERPDVSCRRCAKAGRPCITTPPTRKRQKKADSRVAELERKIDALTATLHAQKSGVPGVPEIRHHGGIPQPGASANAIPMPVEGQYRMGTVEHDWAQPPTARYPDIPAGYGPAQSLHRGPEPKRRKMDNAHATIPEDMDAIHRDLAEHPEMRRTSKNKIHADHSHISALIDNLMTPDIAERVFLRYVNEICPHFPAVPFPPGTTAREVREKKPLLFLAVLAGSSHGSAEQLVSQEAQRELTKLLKDQLADIIWRNGEKSLEIVQALHISVLWYRPPLHFEQHNFYMMVNCAAVMALDLGLGRKATPNVMRLSVGPFKRYHPNSSSVEARRTFLVCYYLCMSITMVLRRPILLRWTNYMAESVRILETSPEALPSDRLLCQQVKMAHIGEKISVEFCMDDPSVEVTISDPKVIYALKIFENELSSLREENSSLGEIDRVRAIYAIVCLMKMWVSVTSSGEVGSIICQEDLKIEAYTEQLVSMFNAIVSRDAQSPHGKFYFVAKRLQERFAHIKEGAAGEQQTDPEYDSTRNNSQTSRPSTRQSPANQTPLHLLSEVAMGSSNNVASQQQQQQTQAQAQAQSRSQQQAQAALQAHAQHSQQAMPNWYPNMNAQPTPDMMGLGAQQPFDINFDFTQFDLGTGSDADLSALFIPDSMAMWGYPADPNMQGGYNGY